MLLDEPGYVMANEGELIKRAVLADNAFFEYARSNTSTRHLDPRTVDIYQSVLEVAWEDKVSFDEYQLIKRLQRKLNVNRRDHRVMEIKVTASTPIGPQEAEQAKLKALIQTLMPAQQQPRPAPAQPRGAQAPAQPPPPPQPQGLAPGLPQGTR